MKIFNKNVNSAEARANFYQNTGGNNYAGTQLILENVYMHPSEWIHITLLSSWNNTTHRIESNIYMNAIKQTISITGGTKDFTYPLNIQVYLFFHTL